jgi:hypothetical protein
MTEHTPLYLRFPDAETALQIARALSGNLDVTELPPDGWHNGVYYNILAIGALYEPQDDPEAPAVALPGYHVNGLWRGSADTIPEALRSFMTFPEDPRVRWG